MNACSYSFYCTLRAQHICYILHLTAPVVDDGIFNFMTWYDYSKRQENTHLSNWQMSIARHKQMGDGTVMIRHRSSLYFDDLMLHWSDGRQWKRWKSCSDFIMANFMWNKHVLSHKTLVDCKLAFVFAVKWQSSPIKCTFNKTNTNKQLNEWILNRTNSFHTMKKLNVCLSACGL